MVNWCPNCGRPYIAAAHNGDYVHNCDSGQSELDEEDVTVIGTWDDGDGNTGGTNTAAALVSGMANKIIGTPAMNKVWEKDLTVRGNPKLTTRTRKRDEYIKEPTS